jgi:hypothetical protein
MTAIKTAAGLICDGSKAPTGIHNSAAAPQHSAASTPPTGVKKPSRRDTPLMTAIKAKMAFGNIAVSDRVRTDTPSKISTIPVVDRNSSRPMPGHPPGNVENSLCSRISFAFSIVLKDSSTA